jgi:7,8-dihydropterin-6-yl-methyl-4-(beta-D-ribofuranosyl)aminobenzene 5'-phosphate synthase
LASPILFVIRQTVEAMNEFNLKTIAAAHCTRQRAINALTRAFGEPVAAPAAAGRRNLFY